MRFTKLTKVALILAVAVGAAFAQFARPVERGDLRAPAAEQNTVSRAFSYDDAHVSSDLHGSGIIAILDMGDPVEEPIVLNRSFREALKENSDRETIERLTR
jgi:hypothetical protein